MSKLKSNISRRSFLNKTSLAAIGTGLISWKCISDVPNENDGPTLWEEHTEKEKEQILNSSMAQDIINYPPMGNSCAESLLKASLKYLGKSEEIGNVAAGFGGGMGRYDLCGLLTAGYMAIGISAGMIHTEHADISSLTKANSRLYWEWWEERGPIHCHDLKPKYSWDRNNYNIMIQRVALKIEELISPAVKA